LIVGIRVDVLFVICAAAVLTACSLGAKTSLAVGPETPGPPNMVANVLVVGNETVKPTKMRSYLQTRPDRTFDPQILKDDVRRLKLSGLFVDVRTFTEATSQGIVVTFEVVESPTIRYVKFIGNKGLSEKALLKESGLKIGDAFSSHTTSEARRKIEMRYLTAGYTNVQISVLEGDKPRDRGVVYLINEGHMAKVFRTVFIGNTIASDSRLKTQIQSKHGFLYLFGGKVDRKKIDEDVDRLTAYYRSLGYFRATVGRELRFDSSGKWLTLTFVINEGPRYRVRNLAFAGNQKYTAADLASRLELKRGHNFNQAQMNRDLKTLEDLYGSQGHVFVAIKAQPRFLEEPGQLDLVYDIQENEQYRVGQITVRIEGDHPHTRQSVVLNRRGNLQPGDIIDKRELDKWKRRLRASQLFLNDPQHMPQVVIHRPKMDPGETSVAGRPRSPASPRVHRGQGPYTPSRSSRYEE